MGPLDSVAHGFAAPRLLHCRHGDDRCVRPANALARIYLGRGEDDRAEAVLVRAFTKKPGSGPSAEAAPRDGRVGKGGGRGMTTTLTSMFGDLSSYVGRVPDQRG